MPQPISTEQAKQKVAKFCALRERSPKEVWDKLVSIGLQQEEISEVLTLLMKEDFVNPQRFANAFCNDKFEFNSWGKQKIKMNISVHQLDPNVVEQALNRIDSKKYHGRLNELALKKWQSLDREPSMKRKQKTVAFLASKGFEMDLIWKVIGEFKK